MGFVFLDEIGVEPLAFVGQPSDINISVVSAIHKVYSGNKLNLLTKYTCGRYINVKEQSRFIFNKATSRIIESSEDKKGNCLT